MSPVEMVCTAYRTGLRSPQILLSCYRNQQSRLYLQRTISIRSFIHTALVSAYFASSACSALPWLLHLVTFTWRHRQNIALFCEFLPRLPRHDAFISITYFTGLPERKQYLLHKTVKKVRCILAHGFRGFSSQAMGFGTYGEEAQPGRNIV